MSNRRIPEYGVLVSPVLFYCALCAVYPFLFVDALKFIVVHAVIYFLPGYVFSRWLLGGYGLTAFESMLFGYPVSVVTVASLSWAGRYLGFRYLTLLMVPLSVWTVWRMMRAREDTKMAWGERRKLIVSHVVLYCAGAGVFFVLFTLTAAPPSLGRPGLFFSDNMSLVGRTWAYIRAFPLLSMAMVGTPVVYHMLQHVTHGLYYDLGRIDPFTTFFYLEPGATWFYFISFLVFGSVRIARMTLRRAVAFAFLLLFTTGGSYVRNSLQASLFWHPASEFFSMPFFVLFLVYMMAGMRDRNDLHPLYGALLFAALASSKAHLLLVVPVTLLLAFGRDLLDSNHRRRALVFGAGVLVVGLAIKLAMYPSGGGRIGTVLAAHEEFLEKIHAVTRYCAERRWLLPLAAGIESGQRLICHFRLVWAVRFAGRLVVFLGNVLLRPPFLLFVLVLVFDNGFRGMAGRTRRQLSFLGAFILASGVVLAFANFAGGNIYFISYASVGVLYCGAMALEHVSRARRPLVVVCALAVLCVGSVEFLALCARRIGGNWWLCPVMGARPFDSRATVDRGEWLAMKWIKENTPAGSVLVSDRRDYYHWPPDKYRRFFAYSALSGRRMYAEGTEIYAGDCVEEADRRWDLIDGLFRMDDTHACKRLLDSMGVSYVIQSKRFNPHVGAAVSRLPVVFENSSVAVFTVCGHAGRNLREATLGR